MSVYPFSFLDDVITFMHARGAILAVCSHGRMSVRIGLGGDVIVRYNDRFEAPVNEVKFFFFKLNTKPVENIGWPLYKVYSAGRAYDRAMMRAKTSGYTKAGEVVLKALSDEFDKVSHGGVVDSHASYFMTVLRYFDPAYTIVATATIANNDALEFQAAEGRNLPVQVRDLLYASIIELVNEREAYVHVPKIEACAKAE